MTSGVSSERSGMPLNEQTIESAVCGMGLRGQDVAVHSSLSSFGHVTGGANAVVAGLLNACNTVTMPSFCGIGRTNAPSGERPVQNAWNYDDQPVRSTLVPFDPDSFDRTSDVDISGMGQIPAALLECEDTLRSKHPSVSWAANGPRAADYTANHYPDDPNQPLKRLVEADGHVLLLGVGLAACTAVHCSEELAGRRPFIRWVLYSDGEVRRIREYGCSDGFSKLAPAIESLATHCAVGNSAAVSYPISPFVETLTQAIESDPEITLCGRQDCRCRASLLGGPVE